ncbi:conserved hypothetical protein [Culex quinquefasciatus]|uniref:Uncharacterized protein n=1 Tax=Culex quinquefasciatus TaxID=7176 RepID=B0VZU3_CULQU|nr:conserved hypothetical protein [Culex quinquefasciatus]|eukprot:XP_001841977.1 conserved hypothetical protein [Culex quinquefasciatus]
MERAGADHHVINFPDPTFHRPTRNIKDITQLSTAGASHDCGSLSRVVMVRKTDQRVINHKGSQKDINFKNFL